VALVQGWPNLLNVRATYDKLQMFESRKNKYYTHVFTVTWTFFKKNHEH
jgi:hypothetical protein